MSFVMTHDALALSHLFRMPTSLLLRETSEYVSGLDWELSNKYHSLTLRAGEWKQREKIGIT